MQNATKKQSQTAAKQTPAKPVQPAPTNSMAATVGALANSAAPVQAAAQPVKKPAVVYVAGVAAGAPANAPVVTLAGQPFNGALPATNPANRGAVGTVKNPNNMLALGKVPNLRAGQNLTYMQAVTAHLTANKGTATAQALANACGHGGGAFVGYALKNGWLAIK